MSSSGPQRIVKIRRDYNTWVATETLEDYALRYAPASFRRWSAFRVANTAFGAVSFLALEAIGGSIAISYGFTNAFWAIVVVGVVVFVTALPIAYYGAKHSIDMDLLTRGAGFGYIGSTITSLIYASFTFIFFALEAAIMAMAIELYFDVPLGIGYVMSSLVIIPLVIHGVTFLSRLQLWTQPLWLVMMLLPYAVIALKNPQAFADLASFGGRPDNGTSFDVLLFGAAATVAFSLITQIAEQVDFLRFLPEPSPKNRARWWASLLVAGPGWIVLGAAKLLGGAFLAFLALQHEISIDKAAEPTLMYQVAFHYVFADPGLVLATVTLFVVVSQIKINVTNAYAGSLAWSNFFSRLTHSHPGRVVWLVFNVVIAVMLMKLGIFAALEKVLGLYSNVAIAWVGALVADLVVNKPLGLSPPYIEFKRAHLYDINPVGFGAMLIASVVSITAFTGTFGPVAQALAPFIALGLAFLLAPLIALLTRGRYYIARHATAHGLASRRCCICEHEFEAADMADCPAYDGPICSLCCTLDARCHDACKPGASLREQLGAFVQVFGPVGYPSILRARIGAFVLRFLVIAGLTAVVFAIVYYQQTLKAGAVEVSVPLALQDALEKIYVLLLVPIGIAAWLLTLKHESHRVAQEESNRQTRLLQQEIEEHRKTDAKLQQAKEMAERANQAKSRFLTGMSHELRTPLNSILGYAQLLQSENGIPATRKQALGIIQQSGQHLLTLINDILEVARHETGRIKLARDEIRFPEFLQQIVHMFGLQARNKGIAFHYQVLGDLPPVVRSDEKRLRQILINLLDNAIKYTAQGEVALIVSWRPEMTTFQIRDTGTGIAASDLEKIFQPFQRGAEAEVNRSEGLGLGLTLSRMFSEIMGGDLSVESTVGSGSTFHVRVPLAAVGNRQPRVRPEGRIVGYLGSRHTVLVVDDQAEHRDWLTETLRSLGFHVAEAATGRACLEQVRTLVPAVVLLDLVMPEMDGYETARRLRALDGVRDTVIIALSANAFAEDRQRSIAAGCDDFLPKPVDLAELLAILKTQLSLEWIEEPLAPAAPEPAPAALPMPPPLLLQQLLDAVRIGYVKGVQEQIDRIERLDQCYAPLVSLLRQLTTEFRLNEIADLVTVRLEVQHAQA